MHLHWNFYVILEKTPTIFNNAKLKIKFVRKPKPIGRSNDFSRFRRKIYSNFVVHYSDWEESIALKTEWTRSWHAANTGKMAKYRDFNCTFFFCTPVNGLIGFSFRCSCDSYLNFFSSSNYVVRWRARTDNTISAWHMTVSLLDRTNMLLTRKKRTK